MADVKGGYQRPTSTSFISSSYQDHKNRTPPSGEPGTDYGCAYGSTLYAPEDGRVVDRSLSTAGGHGRYVTIDFDDGQRGRALHLASVSVAVGSRVKRGQAIGRTGASAWGKEWGVGAHVHQSLFEVHAYAWHRLVDFERQVGGDNDGAPAGSGGLKYSQDVANQMNFLNVAQGEKLVVDGLPGPLYRAAVKRYQTYLKGRGWYSGAIDGIWGAGTQAGHNKRYAEWSAPHAPANPQYHTATVADLGSIGDVRGLQKVANLYLPQSVDNQWGAKSRDGFQRFLNQNYGGSLAAWLRAKYGYVGNDQWGPVMKAAAQRASAANLRAL